MITGVVLVVVAFAAMLATLALLSRQRPARSAPAPSGRTGETQPVEPFLKHAWYTMHWLPWRYTRASPFLGITFGLVAWGMLVPRSRWVSVAAFIAIVIAGEYSGEGVWRALQSRAWGLFAAGLVGSLLCVCAMGLHAGVLVGVELAIPLPTLP